MMKNIKIVHHTKYLGYSGTDKTAQLMVKYLNKLDDFEAYLIYQDNGDKSRLEWAKQNIGEKFLIEYYCKNAVNPPSPYWPAETNFKDKLAELHPDIYHFHRSGYQEWLGEPSVIPPDCKTVETCIFGYNDLANPINCRLFVSKFVKDKAGITGEVLPNPIEIPIVTESRGLLRTKFRMAHNLPLNAVICLRVGRPDNFTDISLQAFKTIEKIYPNTYYFILGYDENWIREANHLRIQNIRYLEPIYGDQELTELYQAADIFVHARYDGESAYGCAISEAMANELPVVSHRSQAYNGHLEILDEMWIARNIDSYERHLNDLVAYDNLRNQVGKDNKRRIVAKCEVNTIIARLAEIYKNVHTTR